MEKGAFKGKHFLALEDFTPEELRYLLDLEAEGGKKAAGGPAQEHRPEHADAV